MYLNHTFGVVVAALAVSLVSPANAQLPYQLGQAIQFQYGGEWTKGELIGMSPEGNQAMVRMKTAQGGVFVLAVAFNEFVLNRRKRLKIRQLSRWHRKPHKPHKVGRPRSGRHQRQCRRAPALRRLLHSELWQPAQSAPIGADQFVRKQLSVLQPRRQVVRGGPVQLCCRQRYLANRHTEDLRLGGNAKD